MSALDLHPTTAVLLARLRTADVQSGAHRAWLDAGCPDAPEPRFVPTVPGWYWRRMYGEPQPVQAFRYDNGDLFWRRSLDTSADPVTDDGLWLGPVAPYVEPAKADVAASRAWYGEAPTTGLLHPDPGPCPPKPRTAEEARKGPMPGDRWRHATYEYTLARPATPAGWWAFGDGGEGIPGGLPEHGETYLGHFPLETP